MGISPAALAALAKGDIENAIVASTPGGIEAQEARGQKSFVASTTLPIKCSYCTREQLEQMGIVFGESVDDLFIEAQLPEGWKKVVTSHSMHSELIDDKGRKRAGIFYKAAFYDQRADISLITRYRASVEPVGGYESDYDYDTTPRIGIVRDCDEVIWQTEPLSTSEHKPHEMGKVLWPKIETWLQENFPDHSDPLAYWD